MFDYGWSLSLEALTVQTSESSGLPLTWAYLPLNPGLTVLYGLNGAGKSLLIHALEEVLTGVQGERTSGLHCRLLVNVGGVGVQEDKRGETSIPPDVVALYQRFADPSFEFSTDFIDKHGRVPAGQVLGRVTEQLEEAFERAEAPAGANLPSLAHAVVRQGAFSVSAAGSERPRWNVQFVARPTSDRTNGINRYLQIGASSGEPPVGESCPLDSFWHWRTDPDPSQVPGLELYEPTFHFFSWEADPVAIPIFGRAHFDPDMATRALMRQVEERIPDRSLEAEEIIRKARSVTLDTIRDPDLRAAREHPAAMREFLRNLKHLKEAFDHTKTALWTLCDLEGWDYSRWLLHDPDGQLSGDCGAAQLADLLEFFANQYYARVLVDAPVLSLRMGSPADWLIGQPPRWGARRSPESAWAPLEYLSEAERKWAVIAIEMAVALRPQGILLVDEPEQALHRSAEAFMARGLAELADEKGLCVVVASHSPELLNQDTADVVMVRRLDQGLADGRQVVPLTAASRQELLDFGLLPSDLLRRQRGFLLVEGQHDLIVMEELLGAELRDLRVELLPMRGAGRLKATLDSRVLYDFTDAHVFVMLDALSNGFVSDVWREAVRLAKVDGVSAAVEHVTQSLQTLKVDEAGMMSAFLARALELGLDGRHTPLTLSAPDILDYLPVEAFVPGAESWDALRAELAQSMGATPSGSKFKNWLKSAKKAGLADDDIRRAAQGLAELPPELQSHLETMRRVLRGQ